MYNGSYTRWVNGNRTFLSYSSPILPKSNFSQPRVTAETSAYFARLDCEVLENLDDHLHRDADSNNPNHSGRFYLNGTDDGCFWRTNFQVSQGFTTYMQTESNTTCSGFGASSFSGRFIVAGGMIQSMTSYDLTVFSCIPTYWTASGNLTMDLDPNARNPIIRWDEDTNSVAELRPQWWNSFEQQIQQVASTDTTTNFNATSATGIGRFILDYARRTSSYPFRADILIKSTQEVFATLYVCDAAGPVHDQIDLGVGRTEVGRSTWSISDNDEQALYCLPNRRNNSCFSHRGHRASELSLVVHTQASFSTL